MFTKALVVSKPEPGSNIYKVRIPLFEDTSGTEIIYDALCCHAPGVYGGFNAGDCVYVSFEDAKLNIPVIIGRLYINERDDYSKGYFNNLEVSNFAHLPMSTVFGDNLTISTLNSALQYMSNNIGCPTYSGDIYTTALNLTSDDLVERWPGTSWTDVGTTTTSNGTVLYNWRRDS